MTAVQDTSPRSGRRLSPLRVVIALVVVAALVFAGFVGVRWWADRAVGSSHKPWFASYVDVTATPTFDFASPRSDADYDVILSFIVADPDEPCTPSWGAAYTMEQASSALDVDRKIARLQQQGGGVVVSFGGLLNDELATACTDQTELTAAYRSVIDRYELHTIDLDIEAGALGASAVGERRAAAIATIQAEHRVSGSALAVWLTLPVAPSGLTADGAAVVTEFLEAGVDLAGVNIMTMDYGTGKAEGQSMIDATTSAITETHRQLGVLYTLAGIELSSATLWTKIGVTPMIGQNDVPDEVFTTSDASALNTFVLENNLSRVSMWSLNRDISCGPNYVDLVRVSDACSGIDQGTLRFADLLGKGLDGRAILASTIVTTAEPVSDEDLTDDPAQSPYQIWDGAGGYLQGTKVVWHRNVYEAKWWTRGDLPDNPVLNTWETPWSLVGPVLPGETPIPRPTLAAGTYPEWSGESVYEKSDRVLFDGTPYEAKWWNTALSPEAASSNPDGSPWVPLTLKQIAEIGVGSE